MLSIPVDLWQFEVVETTDQTPILELSDVHATLGTRRGRTVALSVPALRVFAGERVAILGPSGCGKSSLLRVLSGLIPVQSGELTIHGENLRTKSPRELDKFRGARIGVIEQTFHLLDEFTARENLLIALRFGGHAARSEKRARELLGRLNVEAIADVRAASLSVGERQRVAIARAVANSPSLVLADEPTAALDEENSDKVIALIEELCDQERSTLLFVTHNQRIADKFPRRFDATNLLTTEKPA